MFRMKKGIYVYVGYLKQQNN